MILNSLSGSADSMATQMKTLKLELENINEEHDFEIQKKDEKIKSLELLIQKSNLQQTEKSEIISAIESTNLPIHKNYLSAYKNYIQSDGLYNDSISRSLSSIEKLLKMMPKESK